MFGKGFNNVSSLIEFLSVRNWLHARMDRYSIEYSSPVNYDVASLACGCYYSLEPDILLL